MYRAGIFGLLAAILLAAPARAAVLEEFTVEDWSGLALSDDETGRLASCAVYSEYQNGVTLFFIKHLDGNWTLSLVRDSWALTDGSDYPVQYRVDGRGYVNATSVALDTDQIGIGFADGHSFLGQVRRGKVLTVAFQGEEYGFDLANSSAALKGAGDCIQRHRDAGGPQVAQDDSPDDDADTESSESEAVEAAEDGTEASTIGERQTFGPWIVTATDDGAGTFVNCTAFGVFGDDQLIISYRPDEVWEFGVYRAAWKLDTNQTYYLWYNVDAPADGAGVIKRPVEAAEATRVYFEVSGEEDVISRMESGREINLQLRGVSMQPESLSYPLDQAAEALAAARACTQRNVEAGQQAGTAAEPESDQPVEGGTEETPKVLPAIGARKIEDFEVPGWTGAAFSDESGAFTHCAIEAEYQNGTTFALLRTAEGPLLMTLRRTDWSLQPGTWVPLKYQFKAADPTTVATEGLGIDSSTMGVNLGMEEMVLMQMRTVPEFVVETQGKSLSFDISDVGPGLEALDSCAERRREAAPAAAEPPPPDSNSSKKRAAGPAPAPAEPERSAAPAPAPDSPEEKVEAAGYTTALLVRAGYPGHIILTGKDVPEALRQRDAAWKVGEIFGMTDVIHGYQAAQIKEEVTRSDTRDCGGPVKSEELGANPAGDGLYFSSFCDSADADFYIFYIVIPREGGGHYNMMLVDLGDGNTARSIGQKLFDTAAAS